MADVSRKFVKARARRIFFTVAFHVEEESTPAGVMAAARRRIRGPVKEKDETSAH